MHKEYIEEICDGADKQLQIEAKLNSNREKWSVASFEFTVEKYEHPNSCGIFRNH